MLIVVSSSSWLGRCDVAKDREKCANELVGLATCLPYVSGESKAPPNDCCTGFKQVLKESKECICLLIKDRNDPSLGFTINATRALSLPTKCNAPLNESVTDCPTILHLPPNSPDAKVFEDFAKSGGGDKTNTTTTATAPPGSSSSSGSSAAATASSNGDGGKKKKILLEAQMVTGLFIVAALHIFTNI
ncbi:hypothetical protein C2S51_023410 [Perilla frutescens var. frutescens]|nr:hypothetical protein C2S51_023410 [Perilla frutescens var. frutescens]